MKETLFTLLFAFATVCGFAQMNSSAARLERRDSILATLGLNERVYSIASKMYFPPAEFYWNDTLYYMDRSPLAYINEKEFLDIYTEWPVLEGLSLGNYSYRGRYDCVWELMGDSLFLTKIRKARISERDKEEHTPYTYEEVKAKMEKFTGGKFGADNKMFASWFSGSLYIMQPFLTDGLQYEEYKAAKIEWGLKHLRRLTFKKGKLVNSGYMKGSGIYYDNNGHYMFPVLETQAEFPGGHKVLTEWIKSNLQYPIECVENKIEGRAFVRFLVKKDGSIDNVKLLKSSGNTLLDQEALRLMNDDDMPLWVPATHFSEAEGKYIKADSRVCLPVVFKLNNLPTCTNAE